MPARLFTLLFLIIPALGSALTEIHTFEDLSNVRNNLAEDYILMADIDASSTADDVAQGGVGWVPIGDFDNEYTGSFNGNGFAISDLTMDDITNSLGLFQSVGAAGRVANLSLIGGSINSGNLGGSITASLDGTISNCAASMSITARRSPGGIAGVVGETGLVENCVFMGSVTDTSENAGGLVGILIGTLSNSYAVASMSSNRFAGGTVGARIAGHTITNCYYDRDVAGPVLGGEGRTTEQMTCPYDTEEVYENWDFSTVWGIDSRNGGYPYLLVFSARLDPIEIASLEDLEAIGNEPCSPLDADYILIADIDASPTADPGYNSGAGWDPIGDSTNPLVGHFRGNFQGNNKTISNLTIVRPGEDYVGLFVGVGEFASVRNLTLENVDISGGSFVGALAGGFDGDAFSCNASGSVTGSGSSVGGFFGASGNTVGQGRAELNSLSSSVNVHGQDQTGGIVGSITESSITSSISTGSVSGTENVGGLAGRSSRGEIQFCTMNGSVQGGGNQIGGLLGSGDQSTIADSDASGSIVGAVSVGGLVGYVFLSSIEKSFSFTDVTGTSQVGGLVGFVHESNVTECYTLSNVFDPPSRSGNTDFGGMFGTIIENSLIIFCYANGTVGGDDRIGGFAGSVDSGSTIGDSFSFTDVFGPTGIEGVGGFVGVLGSARVLVCFASGQINRDTPEGGMVGAISSGDAVVGFSYWNTQTTGQTTSAGGGEGLTTAQMTFPFESPAYTDWDFALVWTSGDASYLNNGYPYHQWQEEQAAFNYLAGPGGSLSGETNQLRIRGSNGSPVTAIPDSGFTFTQWSDGSTDNPRIDKFPISGLTLTAEFASVGAEEYWQVY